MTTSQQQRQSQLFAAEDWRVLYTAFTKVNFSSYDFNTIRAAMVNYIRMTYPEDFNDWIESSEFVAIIDLLSYLGQSLAFRMDLNTRENFLDTATRRESIFRLARMLSYQPQRSIPSQGMLKITQVLCTQDIFDANGLNLNGSTITWNDQNNPDWFEQFILIMNSAMNSTNTFGNPSANGVVSGVDTELYQLNNTIIPTSAIGFTSPIGGNSMDFELVNPDFVSANTTGDVATGSGYFYERAPNPLNSWNIIYRNDGNGNQSPNTGFFLMFKQGTIGYADYRLDFQVANRVIDLDVSGINQNDVWVQNIDTAGLVTKDWVKVPSVNGFNVIYNSIDRGERDIYSVITSDSNGSDQISLRFADGDFANVPLGLIRVWYRVSNGLVYQIRPGDMVDLKFNFNYTDNINNTYSLLFNASLQTTVANSQSRQSNEQIKLNASQVYYTQDRMVNGEDYNIYPLQSSQALKIKAVNRTYSGHSRYMDINDPTGSYQNLNIFSEDGMLFQEITNNRQDVPINSIMNSTAVVMGYIQPIISGSGTMLGIATELRDFFLANYPRYPSNLLSWRTINSTSRSVNGAFFNGSTAVKLGSAVRDASTQTYIRTGSLVKFAGGDWTAVMSVVGDGDGVSSTGMLNNGQGAVTLNSQIRDGDLISYIVPAWRTTLTNDEVNEIAEYIDRKQTFGIGFDHKLSRWYPIANDNLDVSDSFSLINAKDATSTGRDSSWMLKLIYAGTSWQIYIRSQLYVFESADEVRFYFANTKRVIDPKTGRAQQDHINVMGINTAPNALSALGQDYLWKIKGQYVYPDGYRDPRSVQVTFLDSKTNGIPDDPEQFLTIADPNTLGDDLLFWREYTSSDGYQYFSPIQIPLDHIFQTQTQISISTVLSTWTSGDLSYVRDSGKFFLFDRDKLVDVTNQYRARSGRRGLKYLWKHFSSYDLRIDPAVNNLIDMYVLTSSYDTDIRNWISSNGPQALKPKPPTTEDLRSTFGEFESYKMMSDQIIWHPVSYKLLFGAQADPDYQVRFKVVKAAGSIVSDSEVKSRVITAINEYFALPNWDFGSSFFFTELAAYIHSQLATVVGSVVIVPLSGGSRFGDLFEIAAQPDEIFISAAKVSDIDIVPALSETTLGITNG
jgi:hypothetical protein